MRRIDAGRWGRLMRDSVAVSCSGVVRLALAACLLHSVPCAAQSAATSHLRIVGSLAGVNQYTRYEEPFWTRELARLSGGRATAEIVPSDRAGIRRSGDAAAGAARRGSVRNLAAQPERGRRCRAGDARPGGSEPRHGRVATQRRRLPSLPQEGAARALRQRAARDLCLSGAGHFLHQTAWQAWPT